jgi:ferredoxin-NADP reductase
MEYDLSLKRFEEVADGTRLFVFSKPEGFVFCAGQYVALRIDPERLVEPDIRGGVRSFSLASAPHEDELHFVMRSGITGFKKTMWDLHPGDTIGCTKAVGHCTIPAADDGKAIVLLSGGVGIAPARAMLRDAVVRKDPRLHILFYSNRFLRDAAFHDELLSVDIPHFRYVFTLSDETDPATEPGEERGYINENMLRKYLPDIMNCHYYVIGAPGFADAMKAMLLGLGIAENEIKIDPFTGLNGPATTASK